MLRWCLRFTLLWVPWPVPPSRQTSPLSVCRRVLLVCWWWSAVIAVIWQETGQSHNNKHKSYINTTSLHFTELCNKTVEAPGKATLERERHAICHFVIRILMGRTISRCEDFISIMMLEQDHPPSGTSGANFQPTVRGERGSSEQHEGARQETFPHHPGLRSQVRDIKNLANILMIFHMIIISS